MARASVSYVCQSCGSVHARWAGRCDACGAWNTLQPEEAVSGPPAGSGAGAALKPSKRAAARALERVKPLSDLRDGAASTPRLETRVGEFDRVCGGGLARGSAILIGGDPGVGKSTLMLQICAALAATGAKALYVTGEESAEQIGLRAGRLGLAGADPLAAAETRLKEVAAMIEAVKPHAVVIDSAQTLWTDALPAAPGSVAQTRACTLELARLAKRLGCCLMLIGHVTKDGQLAGPKVVEHMVDAVLMLEGDRTQRFRILRSVKNRFGPTDEIGVFEMSDGGMIEVDNPSALFLGDRSESASGSAVLAGIEGTRPMLVEIQALVAPTSGGPPRRTVAGWDGARLAMSLAMLQTRCGLDVSGCDVYLNVAGGLRVTEPAADLAAAAAIVSSHFDAPLPSDCVGFGEAALSGAVRPVGRTEARLKEAAKLGFRRAICPPLNGADPQGLDIRDVRDLNGLVDALRESG